MIKRIIKHTNHFNKLEPEVRIVKEKVENNVEKQVKDMTTNEILELEKTAESIQPATIKRTKKDKGLIERVESSKVVLTEDNRQLLND